jgi:hypothetical protein
MRRSSVCLTSILLNLYVMRNQLPHNHPKPCVSRQPKMVRTLVTKSLARREDTQRLGATAAKVRDKIERFFAILETSKNSSHLMTGAKQQAHFGHRRTLVPRQPIHHEQRTVFRAPKALRFGV